MPALAQTDMIEPEPEPVAVEPPPPPVMVPMPAPVAPVMAPAPRTVKVRVVSRPPGAEVWWESVQKGLTPLEMELPQSSDQIELALKLSGHVDGRARFFANQDQEVAVTLQAAKVKSPRKKPLPRSDRGPTSAGEIKGNPYGK